MTLQKNGPKKRAESLVGRGETRNFETLNTKLGFLGFAGVYQVFNNRYLVPGTRVMISNAT